MTSWLKVLIRGLLAAQSISCLCWGPLICISSELVQPQTSGVAIPGLCLRWQSATPAPMVAPSLAPDAPAAPFTCSYTCYTCSYTCWSGIKARPPFINTSVPPLRFGSLHHAHTSLGHRHHTPPVVPCRKAPTGPATSVTAA